MAYEPRPIDTTNVKLASDLLDLVELLAAHNHDIWAVKRISEGWKYGPARNDDTKTHPDLVPYEQLPESEKEYDRESVRKTLMAIVTLGYRIRKP